MLKPITRFLNCADPPYPPKVNCSLRQLFDKNWWPLSLVDPIIWYQTWHIYMVKTFVSSPRPPVTTEDWESGVIFWRSENALDQLVSLSPSFWYQTWHICMAKTFVSSSRSLVTSEDWEVGCVHLEVWKCRRSISLVEPIILTPNITYLYDQNFWVIFEVTGDLKFSHLNG